MIRKSNQSVDPRCGQEVKGAVGKKGNASAKSGSRFDLLEGVDPQVHEGNTSGAQMARQLDLLSRTLFFLFIIHLKSIGFLSMGRDPVGGSSHLYQCSDSLLPHVPPCLSPFSAVGPSSCRPFSISGLCWLI